jgi:hypothetical protein
MNYFTDCMGAILFFVVVICAFIASILLNQSHTFQVFNYDKLSVQLCKVNPLQLSEIFRSKFGAKFNLFDGRRY